MLVDGEEMLLWCRGGRALLKRQTFPPALEIREEGGSYILDDADPSPANWFYAFIPDGEL